MKISKQAYYGLRAMVSLAQAKQTLSVRALAHTEGLPEEYLEKIAQKLRRAGIVEAIKGQSGGYRLALKPEHITANHILQTLDGPLVPFPCSPENVGAPCPSESICSAGDVWKKLSLALTDTLDSITLADLSKTSRQTARLSL